MPYADLEARKRVSRNWATRNRALNRDRVLAATKKWRKENPEQWKEIEERSRTPKKFGPTNNSGSKSLSLS